MTFTDLVSETMSRLNLTSAEATMRIGKLINARYRRVSSSLGLMTSRQTTVTADTVIADPNVTFELEKIQAIYRVDTNGNRAVLAERTLDQLRNQTDGTGDPTEYAILNMGASTVTVRLNVVPTAEITLYADGLQTLTTLSGALEPPFPGSFHDILIYGALADELAKMEKAALAQRNEQMYERLLSDLRLFIAKSAYLEIYQNASTRPRWMR